MPFGVKKSGSKWVVYRKDTGTIKSHHASKKMAEMSKGYAERGSKDLRKGSPLKGLV